MRMSSPGTAVRACGGCVIGAPAVVFSGQRYHLSNAYWVFDEAAKQRHLEYTLVTICTKGKQ